MGKRNPKRTNGIGARFSRWLLGDEVPTVAQATSRTGIRNEVDLPSSFDDAPLTGDVYIRGKCCKTVGDLKEANRTDPTMGGWSG